jgi:hypothetical protein
MKLTLEGIDPELARCFLANRRVVRILAAVAAPPKNRSGLFAKFQRRLLRSPEKSAQEWDDEFRQQARQHLLSRSDWEMLITEVSIPTPLRAYTQTLTALWDTAASGALDEPHTNDILRQMNALAEHDRTLAQHQAYLERLPPSHEPPHLQERLAAQRKLAAQSMENLAHSLHQLKISAALGRTSGLQEAEQASETVNTLLREARALEQALEELDGFRAGG